MHTLFYLINKPSQQIVIPAKAGIQSDDQISVAAMQSAAGMSQLTKMAA